MKMRYRFTTGVVLFVIQMAAYLHAAVIITSDVGIPTPNLPGYRTITFTATSTVAGEEIQGFDFAAHPDNNDPQFGFGVFGRLNQFTIVGGAVPTIFTDNNAFIPILYPGHSYLEDSQFLVSRSNEVIAGVHAEESESLMQASWVWPDPVGQSVAFAQVVTPVGGDFVDVLIRGIAYVTRGGTLAEVPVGDLSALPPRAVIRGNGITIAPGDITPSLIDNTDFGVVDQFSAQTRSFRAFNFGVVQNRLLLKDAVVEGPFSILEQFPIGISANTSGEPLTISLDTTAAGWHSGSITFSTNDPYKPTYRFDLAAQVVPELSSLSFSLIATGILFCARRRFGSATVKRIPIALSIDSMGIFHRTE